MPIDPVSIASATLAILASGDVIRSVTPWIAQASRVSPATVDQLLRSGSVLLPPVLQISPQQIQRALRSGTLDTATTRELRLLQQQLTPQPVGSDAHEVAVELELHKLKLAIDRADISGTAAIASDIGLSPLPAPAPPAASLPLADLAATLRELAQLHRDGLLTNEDFAPLRTSILASIRQQLGLSATQKTDGSALSDQMQRTP